MRKMARVSKLKLRDIQRSQPGVGLCSKGTEKLLEDLKSEVCVLEREPWGWCEEWTLDGKPRDRRPA